VHKLFYLIKDKFFYIAIIIYYSIIGRIFYSLSQTNNYLLIKSKGINIYSPVFNNSFFKSIKWGSFRGIYREIFIRNIYNKCYKLNKGDVVIDCGANVGYYTCYAATRVGSDGLVIAIEPNKKIFEVLSMNVKINKFKNVLLINKGVWDKKGKLKFFPSEIFPQDSKFFSYPNNYIDDCYEVDVDTIDNIVNEFGIGIVNFIKIDIEGSELNAIKGATNILKSNENIKFSIASYHKNENNEITSKSVINYLDSIDIKNIHLSKNNFVYKY